MLCLFEDELAANFNPVGLTRHVADLLVGTKTLRQRALEETDERRVVLHGRGYIREYYGSQGEEVNRPHEPTLFVNARLLMTEAIYSKFPTSEQWVLRSGSHVVAARLDVQALEQLNWGAEHLDFSSVASIELHDSDASLVNYLWDLIYANGARIEGDFREGRSEQPGRSMNGAYLMNEGSIRIGSGSTIKPGAVLDATNGPIIIGENVEVMPNAVIEGPCFVGDNSRIKIGAKIYGQTSIGPWCKVGGEVENSIILGYTNKQHDGFLGHSYLGAWVNLGADTNTSDLKNNYGSIRVRLNGTEVDSQRMFLGSLIGDHAKTGINTMLNTGTVIGVAANVFGGGFPPKEIPSFAWGGSEGFETFRLDRALELAARVMSRRNVKFTEADEELLRYIFDRTAIRT